MHNYTYYLSLGSNVEPRLTNLKSTLEMLSFYGFEPMKISGVYQTAPLYRENLYPFLNACVKARSSIQPQKALLVIKRIERTLGRIGKLRPHERYRNRVADIDVVLIEEVEVSSEELSVPHPDFLNRSFVLFPLLEVIEKKSKYYRDVVWGLENLKEEQLLGIRLVYKDFYMVK